MLLPEGQAGESWEPSNILCCFGSPKAQDANTLRVLMSLDE